MQLSLWVGSLLLSSSFAQQPGMYGGISTGRIVGSITDPGFAGRLGATVSGLPQTSGAVISAYPHSQGGHAGGGQQWRGRPNRTVVVPYGVPVFYGGGYSGGYGYGGGYMDANVAPPQQTIVQQVQPSPSVIINQYYTPDVVRPQMRDYSDLPEPSKQESPVKVYPPPQRDPLPEPPAARVADEPKATITLLAFTDSSVIAAIGYWIQDDTLHFVTSSFVKKTAPVTTLDKSLTEQFNRERKVEFKLEGLR